jgi:O-antigen/teichoic acid export membrane protein
VPVNDSEREAVAARGDLGRGFVYVTGAKLYFLVTATFTSLAFPRLFGDPVPFGRYRVVTGVLNVVTMVVITATIQATSRLAAAAGSDLRAVRTAALAVQAAIFGTVFVAMFALADVIAGGWLGDVELGTPLRVASLVVAAYAAYAVLVGLLNGRKRFGAQAGLDVTFSTLKTGLMIAAVVATASAAWAFGAFAFSAFAVLGVAVVVARLPTGGARQARLPVREYLRYLLPLAGYALVLNLLLQADVIALKAFATGPDVEGLATAADRASALAGIYGAARNVALLPYQAVISLAFIVFPVVSRSSSEGDERATAAATGGAMRLAAVLCFAAVALLGAAPREVLALLYGGAYAEASPVLVMLLAGGALAALMYVGNAVLASSGHPGVSTAGGVAAVVVQLAALALMVPAASDAAGAFVGAALATLLGTSCGAGLTVALLRRVAPGARWGWTAAMSVAAAAAGVASSWPAAGLPWPARCALSLLVFCVVMGATRAITPEDAGRIRSLFRKRG